MLIRHLRRRRKDIAWLAAWSLVQSLPAVASGWSLAQATTQFLAGRTALGLAWLGVLAAAALAGAFGTRQVYLRIGVIVEPFRDDLVTAIVDGALARPDPRSVARMTHQAEIVRDSVAGVLVITCTFACTVVSTLAGLVTLLPATLPYVVPPLLASVILLRLLLRPYAARQRAAVLAEESVAAEVARAASAARDITACGAEDLVFDGLARHIARQEKAARRVAAAGSARLLCLAVGGWLPLLLVLAAAPGMLRRGASPGDIVGAVTYITGSLRGILYTLSQGMGAGLVRLNVTLERILQTSARPGTPARNAAGSRRPYAVGPAHARTLPNAGPGRHAGAAGRHLRLRPARRAGHLRPHPHDPARRPPRGHRPERHRQVQPRGPARRDAQPGHKARFSSMACPWPGSAGAGGS